MFTRRARGAVCLAALKETYNTKPLENLKTLIEKLEVYTKEKPGAAFTDEQADFLAACDMVAEGARRVFKGDMEKLEIDRDEIAASAETAFAYFKNASYYASKAEGIADKLKYAKSTNEILLLLEQIANSIDNLSDTLAEPEEPEKPEASSSRTIDFNPLAAQLSRKLGENPLPKKFEGMPGVNALKVELRNLLSTEVAENLELAERYLAVCRQKYEVVLKTDAALEKKLKDSKPLDFNAWRNWLRKVNSAIKAIEKAIAQAKNR